MGYRVIVAQTAHGRADVDSRSFESIGEAKDYIARQVEYIASVAMAGVDVGFTVSILPKPHCIACGALLIDGYCVPCSDAEDRARMLAHNINGAK